MKPALSEQNTAWALRAAWGRGSSVRLTMSDRCMLQTIVGQVTRVSVTGAFAVVDGWHVPCSEILGIGKPTRADRDAYRRVVGRLELAEAAA